MKWSKWPYWLRGGVIVAGIGALLTYADLRCMNSVPEGAALADLKCIFTNWPAWPLQIILHDTWNLFSTSYYVAYISLIWFVIGSFLGMIVGYFKKKAHSVE